jgi:hypothetical protein
VTLRNHYSCSWMSVLHIMESSTYFNLQVLLRRDIASIVTLLIVLSAIVWSRSPKDNASFLAALSLTSAFLINFQLDHIPTVGSKGSFLSFFEAFRYLWDANKMVQEGYYKVRPCQVPPVMNLTHHICELYSIKVRRLR